MVFVMVAAGVAAGWLGRLLLARLRRGAVVRCGWCEVVVALLWAVLGWRVADGALPWWWLPVPLTLTWFAVLLTVTDVAHRRLPDALTLSAYPVVAAAVLVAAGHGGWRLAAGAAVGAGLFLAVHLAAHLLVPAALGAGDVKLSGSAGAVLGAVGLPALVVATALAAVVTVALRWCVPRRLARRWRDGVPHGPGLLAATCAVAVFPGSGVITGA
jgi:leader peptidase (prepilin peptidase) / N-methyltransferase